MTDKFTKAAAQSMLSPFAVLARVLGTETTISPPIEVYRSSPVKDD